MLEARCFQGGVEATTEGAVLDVLAGRVDEDEIVVARPGRSTAQLVKGYSNLVDHRDAANAAGLRHVLRPHHVGMPDVDKALVELEVTPAEAPQLAETKTGVGGGKKDRGVLLVLFAQLLPPLGAGRVLRRLPVSTFTRRPRKRFHLWRRQDIEVT